LSLLLTAPSTIEIGSAEVFPLGFDFARLLLVGESAGNPAATLVDLADGSTYAAGIVAGTVNGTGTVVTLALTSLQPGHRYRLTVTCVAALNKTLEAAVVINCPF
jgi:hypothetical protein